MHAPGKLNTGANQSVAGNARTPNTPPWTESLAHQRQTPSIRGQCHGGNMGQAQESYAVRHESSGPRNAVYGSAGLTYRH